MPYIADKPKLSPPSAELRAKIKGWGVDLDPAVRPAVPKERLGLAPGAHWTFPERQEPTYEREKSTEHAMLTPVFGTSCPPRGVSGLIRRWAYKSFSEGRSAHWMLLALADRVDVVESRLRALATGEPDVFFREAGLAVELKPRVFLSRFGQHRADLAHLPVDVLQVAAGRLISLAAVVAIGLGVRAAVRRLAA